jgi:hypothetical protein
MLPKLVRDKHVQKLLAKVEDMKVVMGRNLNLLMERGENIDSGQQINSCEKTRYFFKEKVYAHAQTNATKMRMGTIVAALCWYSFLW